MLEKSEKKSTDYQFTKREMDLLACIVKGHTSSKQISTILGVSPKTVEIHIGNILSKTGFHSRHQLPIFAINLPISNDLAYLFQHKIFPKSLLRDALQKKQKFLPRAPSTYYIINDKSLKNDIELISIHLEQMVGNNVYTVDRQPHFLSHNTFWSIYFDSTLHGWVISPPFSKGQDHEQLHLIQLNPSQDFVFFFLNLIAPAVPPTWHNQLTDDVMKQLQQIPKKDDTTQQLQQAPKIEAKQTVLSKKNITKNQIKILLFAIFFLIPTFIFIKTNTSPLNITNIRQSPEVKKHFLERKKIEKNIKKFLHKKKDIQSVVLLGAGGAGKTSLARHFIKQQSASVVWEIRSDNHEHIVMSFEKLANELAVTEEDKREIRHITCSENIYKKKQEILSFVRNRLKKRKHWILLYDNVEKFNEDDLLYTPDDPNAWGNGWVLYTSRNSNLCNSSHIGHHIKVEELNSQEVMELVQLITASQKKEVAVDEDDFKLIAEKLVHLPLDVAMATYYVCDLRLTWKQYFISLQSRPSDIEKSQEEVWTDMSSYKRTRLAITNLIVSSLTNMRPENARLLKIISMIETQSIPRELLYDLENQSNVDLFIRDLKKYSLVIEEENIADHYSFSLHRYTQAMIRKCLRDDPEANQSLAQALDNFILKTTNSRRHDLVIKLSSHANEFNQHCSFKLKYDGILYYHMGWYEKAAQTIEETLEKQMHSPKELEILYFCAGQTYKQMLNAPKVKEFFHKGINVCNDFFPNEPGRLVKFYTNLGSFYRWIKEFDQAKQACEMALACYKRCSISREEDIMELYSTLGGIYRSEGNYQKAEEFLKMSVDMYQRHAPQFALEHARTLLMLGQVYITQGLFKEAQPFYEKSLAISQSILPPEDIKMAWCYVRVGHLFRLLGKNKQALHFLEKGRSGCAEQSASHQVCQALLNEEMAYLYVSQKDLKKARECANFTYTTYARIYGEEDVRTACALNTLAYTELHNKKIEEAEIYLKKSIITLNKHNHPLRYQSLQLLGLVYAEKSKIYKENSQIYKNQASLYFNQALSAALQHFPPHSDYVNELRKKMLLCEVETDQALLDESVRIALAMV